MLKGHTFKKQLFSTEAHMRLINMLTGGLDGILNIGDKLDISYNLNQITISSGVAVIQGNIVEEDSSTTIDVTGMCQDYGTLSLVIEIDLDKENTEEELKQVTYKVLQGRIAFPDLTKEDIVKNGTGIYQYELARFNTSVIGITEMIDSRTYIDLATIFSNTQETKPILSNDVCCIEKEHISNKSDITTSKINYPEGFDKDNTLILQVMRRFSGYSMNETWEFGSFYDSSNCITITLEEDGIQIADLRECDDIKIIIAKKPAIPIVKASEVP